MTLEIEQHCDDPRDQVVAAYPRWPALIAALPTAELLREQAVDVASLALLVHSDAGSKEKMRQVVARLQASHYAVSTSLLQLLPGLWHRAWYTIDEAKFEVRLQPGHPHHLIDNPGVSVIIHQVLRALVWHIGRGVCRRAQPLRAARAQSGGGVGKTGAHMGCQGR